MKTIAYLIIILLCFSACKPKKSQKSFIDNIYKLLDTTNIVDSNSFIDYKLTLLKNDLTYFEIYTADSIKAMLDIKRNHLIYPYTDYDYTISYDYFKKNLKEKHKINTLYHLRSCIVDDSSKYLNAYIRLMRIEINNRFGKSFIPKLIVESDSIFYYKNKDSIYNFQNSYALLKYYQTKAYRKYRDSIKEELQSLLKYPKNYNYKNESKRTYTSAYFILSKNGSIDSLYVESHFANEKNEKFREFFEKQVRDYFSNKTLKPVEIYGLKIYAEEHFTIYHR